VFFFFFFSALEKMPGLSRAGGVTYPLPRPVQGNYPDGERCFKPTPPGPPFSRAEGYLSPPPSTTVTFSRAKKKDGCLSRPSSRPVLRRPFPGQGRRLFKPLPSPSTTVRHRATVRKPQQAAVSRTIIRAQRRKGAGKKKSRVRPELIRLRLHEAEFPPAP